MQTLRGLNRTPWAICLAICLAFWAQPSDAAFPGANGKIAFAGDRDAQGNLDIYVMNPDGSRVTRLTDDPDRDSTPAWSPDGSRIAFVRGELDSADIWVMNADGSGKTRLTTDPAYELDPAWSPDGSRIAFVKRFEDSDPIKRNPQIYTMSSDGTGQVNLTNDPAATHWAPAWSPDGSAVAFVRVAGRRPEVDLWMMNVDGTERTSLTSTPAPETEWAPAWSPDGTKIAFGTIAFADGAPLTVKVMNPDGTMMVTLLDYEVGHVRGAGSPTWSPDGTMIAFIRSSGLGATQTSDVWLANADGSGEVELTNTPEAIESDPTWQPLRTLPPMGGPGPEGGSWGWPTLAWLAAGAALALSGVVLIRSVRAPSEGQG